MLNESDAQYCVKGFLCKKGHDKRSESRDIYEISIDSIRDDFVKIRTYFQEEIMNEFHRGMANESVLMTNYRSKSKE
jgi:hypothetical protein